MQCQRGDIFSVDGIRCFGANSTLDANGSLVMGAGAALRFRSAHPGINAAFGHLLRAACASGGEYGFIFEPTRRVGAFQSKTHWRTPSTLELIERSANTMNRWLNGIDAAVHLCMPGVGLGGLKRADVLDVLKVLPDQVTVWELS